MSLLISKHGEYHDFSQVFLIPDTDSVFQFDEAGMLLPKLIFSLCFLPESEVRMFADPNDEQQKHRGYLPILPAGLLMIMRLSSS